MKTLVTIKQANASAYKRKQGKQWIPVCWDASRKIWVEGYARDYWRACAAVREHRDAVISGEIEGA